jgi:hypothetical protein
MHKLISTCTATRTQEPQATLEQLPNNLTMKEAIEGWTALLKSFKATHSPRELYRGMGFLTLNQTLRQHNIEEAYIVTGGQGLIGVDEPIVPYDFTADKSASPNIWEKVTAEPFIQTSWWRMINQARGKGENPVANLINNSSEPSEVVISCPKIFLRYISSDILATKPDKLNNFRVLLSSSSLGSVPVQLRPYIVSFERSSINHLPGNRNDANHRAAQMFLDALARNPKLAAEPPHVQKAAIFGVPEPRGKVAADIREILSNRPELLEMEPEAAYELLYKERGPIGGRLRFKGAFMEVKGTKLKAVKADDDALEILDSLGLQGGTPGGTRKEDDEAVRLAQMFTAALKTHAPDAYFQAADLSTWTARYCAKKGEKVPGVISTTLKTSYFLKTHAPLLGMKQAGKGYILV